MTSRNRSIGHLMREWRLRRRLSQSELAELAGISPRHLSFLETGRAQPGRETLLFVADRLGIPLREQNTLLRAAGFAAVYPEWSLDDPGFRQPRQTIDLILALHEPHPAMAIDRRWTTVATNSGFASLVAGVDQLLLTPPVNFIRLSLHPAGLAPRIINLAWWRRYLIERLRQRVELTGDPALADLAEEVNAYPVPAGVDAARTAATEPNDGSVPLRFATARGPLAFYSTTTAFGGPADITLSELTIEAFFPADPATAAIMARLVAEQAEPLPARPPLAEAQLEPRAASG